MGVLSPYRSQMFYLASTVSLSLAVLVVALTSRQLIGAEAGTEIEKSSVPLSFLGLEGPIPRSWKSEQPSSSMRLAQYVLPGAQDAGPARVVVFYFGPGQGGNVDANIARWSGQFSSKDGKRVVPSVDTFESAGMKVTLAAFHGTYGRGIGTGPKGTPQPDQTLLAAIVETARGNAFIQLYGPETTVNANRPAFERFLHGLRVVGS